MYPNITDMFIALGAMIIFIIAFIVLKYQFLKSNLDLVNKFEYSDQNKLIFLSFFPVIGDTVELYYLYKFKEIVTNSQIMEDEDLHYPDSISNIYFVYLLFNIVNLFIAIGGYLRLYNIEYFTKGIASNELTIYLLIAMYVCIFFIYIIYFVKIKKLNKTLNEIF